MLKKQYPEWGAAGAHSYFCTREVALVLQSTWTILYGDITMGKEIMDMTELLHTLKSADIKFFPAYFA